MISNPVDFGWLLPSGTQRMPEGTVSYTTHIHRIVEELTGTFHSVWVPDHLMDGVLDIPEAMVSMSFLAGRYPDLHLGTAVLGQSYRNPALLAKMGATLQQLSGGRFILGIGAGWKEDEYLAYDYPFPKASVRIAQLAEAVQICKALWASSDNSAEFTGQYYQLKNAVCRPVPVPPPPIMIGGGGERLTLRVVAKHADWWNLPGATPNAYAHKLDVLAEHCKAVGRPLQQIRKTWMGIVSIASSHSRAVEQMESFPIWPGDVPLLGTPAEIRTQLSAYQALGVDMFILSFADEPDLTGIELFMEKVLLGFLH